VADALSYPMRSGARPEPALRVIEAQRLIDLIGLKVMPALAAALLTYAHLRDMGAALLIAASMLAAPHLVTRTALPIEMMPASRLALALLTPLTGVALALALTAASERQLELAALVVPLVGASLVMALGVWVKTRFAEARRVRVAVIGPQDFAADLAYELRAADVGGYEVVGWLGHPVLARHDESLEWFGGVDAVRSAVLDRGIELLVCVGNEHVVPGRESELDRDLPALVTQTCLDLPVRMIDANQFYEELLGHVPLGTIDSAWFRYMMHPRFHPTSTVRKRCFDLVAGALAAIVALPLIAVAALAIKLTDGGPVFYRQRRVGERGQEFQMVKLRTMVPDAEAAGPRWCAPRDERITPLGKFLRRTHIDELPQLWNVARGEMTLVGPRPERPEIVADLEARFPHYGRRHLVKPGITGWAQLRCGYGGSEMGTAWKLCHDLFYVKHRSLLTDTLILVETVAAATRDAHRALRAPQERFIVGEAGSQCPPA
jgi:exopolysaccharide biosynthesis polyprenyl glycosylphosphotransferase